MNATNRPLKTAILDRLISCKHALPFGGYPLQRQENYRPFFIIGSGRSGNTLLRRILYAHSALHIPPETYVLGRVIRIFRQYRRANWKDLVFLTLAQLEYYPEFETFEIALRPLANRLLETSASVRSLAFIVDSFFRYHAEQHGIACQRWGDKTPLNTFSLSLIHSVFPDAQFIHMIRDGCDVVSSYVEAGIYQNIDDAGRRWRDSIQAAERFSHSYPGSCWEIRYEALVSQPEHVVRQLCGFLDIDFENSMLDSHPYSAYMGDVTLHDHHHRVHQPISLSSIGKGRTLMSKSEKARLQGIIGKTLHHLGYEPCI